MTENKKRRSDSISERRFRRHNRAAERRRKAAQEDSRFFRAVFSLAGVTAAFAIGLAVFGLSGGSIDPASMDGLLAPWIGPLSRLDIAGLAFILLLGGLYFWRIRKR